MPSVRSRPGLDPYHSGNQNFSSVPGTGGKDQIYSYPRNQNTLDFVGNQVELTWLREYILCINSLPTVMK